MPIREQIENIRTKSDFTAFTRALNQSYRENPESWENNTIERYLEALAAWVDDMDGYYINQGKTVPEQPNWKIMAEILLAATMYE